MPDTDFRELWGKLASIFGFKQWSIIFVLCYFSINCFCGNRVPANDQKVDDNDCDKSCAGDSSITCGGDDRIQLYDLNSK